MASAGMDSPGRGKWPLVVAAVVLIVVAGGAAAWFLLLGRPGAGDAQACDVARLSNSKQGWQTYLSQNPDGTCKQEAWKQLAAIASQERQKREQAEAEKRAAEDKLLAQARKEAQEQEAANEPPAAEGAEKPAAAQAKRPGKIVKIKQPGKRLVWLRCPIGQEYDGSACQGEAAKMNWKNARQACPHGFRLPVRRELIGLLGKCDSDVRHMKYGYCNKCEESKTCSAMFGHDQGRYWSTDTYAYFKKFAWYANFETGIAIYDFKTNLYNVRCLRGR